MFQRRLRRPDRTIRLRLRTLAEVVAEEARHALRTRLLLREGRSRSFNHKGHENCFVFLCGYGFFLRLRNNAAILSRLTASALTSARNAALARADLIFSCG